MENKNLSFIYSWPAIILAFFVIWPLGVYLLIKRISLDKKTAMTAGKITKVLAYVLLGFTALGFLGTLTSGTLELGVIIVLGLFAWGGIFMLRKSNKICADAERTKKYISIIINGNVRQIDTIASSVGVMYDVAKKDIQKMIDQGYFKNAYINEGSRELVIPTPAPRATTNNIFNNSASQSVPQTRVVACPCCGANNTITGSVGECEYCGSPLK